ncbi:MAG: DoxX family protein [Actinomycetota bacterium]
MKIVEWVLAVLLALMMLGAGIGKLFVEDSRTELADQINVPGWFLLIVGVWEILLVILLLWPRFRIVGGLGVLLTMVVAAVLHIVALIGGGEDQVSALISNVVIGAGGAIVAWLAAGRPGGAAAVVQQGRRQALGQFDAVVDAADAVT